MDRLLKIISKDKGMRMYIADTKELVEDARIKHKTTKVVTAALGRTLTANALIGADLKNETDSVSVQFRTIGPIGNIITHSDANCEVKGYVTNPKVDLPLKPNGKLDVSGALTLDGSLTVVKDIGLKEPYTGTIPLVSGEIAEDITYYYAKSEQIPTSVALGVLVDKDTGTVLTAGGMMIQLMPDADDEMIENLEKVLSSGFTMTDLLTQKESLEEIAEFVLKDIPYEILSECTPVFKCDCSKTRFTNGLISLGKKELKEMIDEGKGIETVCHFCNKNYLFTVDELKKLYKKIK